MAFPTNFWGWLFERSLGSFWTYSIRVWKEDISQKNGNARNCFSYWSEKQGSQSTIFLEAAMRARLHRQAVRENNYQSSAERIGWPEKRRTIGDAIRVSCRTEHAVQEVQKRVDKAFSMKRNLGGFCVVTLDVKNAFNTANWEHIYQALHRTLLEYLMKIASSYLEVAPQKSRSRQESLKDR